MKKQKVSKNLLSSFQKCKDDKHFKLLSLSQCKKLINKNEIVNLNIDTEVASIILKNKLKTFYRKMSNIKLYDLKTAELKKSEINKIYIKLKNDKYILIKKSIIREIYDESQSTNLNLQSIINPIISPGPIHLFFVLEYDLTVLELFGNRFGVSESKLLIVIKIQRILKAILEKYDCDQSIKSIEHTYWSYKINSNRIIEFQAHFPCITFESLTTLQSFTGQFMRFLRKSDSYWIYLPQSIPFIIDDIPIIKIEYYEIGKCLNLPFYSNVANESKWIMFIRKGRFIQSQNYNHDYEWFYCNHFPDRAIKVLDILNSELSYEVLKKLTAGRLTDSIDTTQAPTLQLNDALEQIGSTIRYQGDVVTVPTAWLKFLNYALFRKQNIRCIEIQTFEKKTMKILASDIDTFTDYYLSSTDKLLPIDVDSNKDDFIEKPIDEINHELFDFKLD